MITKALKDVPHGTLVRLKYGAVEYNVIHLHGSNGTITTYALAVRKTGKMWLKGGKTVVILLNEDGTDKGYVCACCGIQISSPGLVYMNSTYCNNCRRCNSCGEWARFAPGSNTCEKCVRRYRVVQVYGSLRGVKSALILLRQNGFEAK